MLMQVTHPDFYKHVQQICSAPVIGAWTQKKIAYAKQESFGEELQSLQAEIVYYVLEIGENTHMLVSFASKGLLRQTVCRDCLHFGWL